MKGVFMRFLSKLSPIRNPPAVKQSVTTSPQLRQEVRQELQSMEDSVRWLDKRADLYRR